MVLTATTLATTAGSPAKSGANFNFQPQRGATLPPKMTLKDCFSAGGGLGGGSGGAHGSGHNNAHAKATRSHTLPNHGSNNAASASAGSVHALNELNRQDSQTTAGGDFPLVSRNAPSSVSIMSLPNSDSEALNFDNR